MAPDPSTAKSVDRSSPPTSEAEKLTAAIELLTADPASLNRAAESVLKKLEPPKDIPPAPKE